MGETERKTEDIMVSVILCFYNEERYLAESIESVLAQTYKNFELILVSDGSTDRSCEIADSYDDPRIKRVYLEQNGGLAAARNAGYEVAEGKYIAHFDGDDILLPDKLSIQVPYMEAHPEISILSGGYYKMDADGNVDDRPVLPQYTEDIDIRAAMLVAPVIANAGASLFKRSLVTEHGVRNDPTMYWCEDFDFWQHCLPYANVKCLSEPFFCYRMSHGSHTSKQIDGAEKKYEDAIKRALEYAWTSRGFSLDEREFLFMAEAFFIKNKMIMPSKMILSERLYQKIKSQSQNLELPEREQLLNIYKKREHDKLFYNRIMKKIKNRIRKGKRESGQS